MNFKRTSRTPEIQEKFNFTNNENFFSSYCCEYVSSNKNTVLFQGI